MLDDPNDREAVETLLSISKSPSPAGSDHSNSGLDNNMDSSSNEAWNYRMETNMKVFEPSQQQANTPLQRRRTSKLARVSFINCQNKK